MGGGEKLKSVFAISRAKHGLSIFSKTDSLNMVLQNIENFQNQAPTKRLSKCDFLTSKFIVFCPRNAILAYFLQSTGQR